MARKLRILIAEFLIETGELIRDLGGFVLPDYEQHPAFESNDALDRAPGPILDSGRGK